MHDNLTVLERNQHRIALETLCMTRVGASIFGTMSHRRAVEVLRSFGHTDEDIRIRLTVAGHGPEEIERSMA